MLLAAVSALVVAQSSSEIPKDLLITLYFLHYLMNATIFGRKLLNLRCVMIFSTT